MPIDAAATSLPRERAERRGRSCRSRTAMTTTLDDQQHHEAQHEEALVARVEVDRPELRARRGYGERAAADPARASP